MLSVAWVVSSVLDEKVARLGSTPRWSGIPFEKNVRNLEKII